MCHILKIPMTSFLVHQGHNIIGDAMPNGDRKRAFVLSGKIFCPDRVEWAKWASYLLKRQEKMESFQLCFRDDFKTQEFAQATAEEHGVLSGLVENNQKNQITTQNKMSKLQRLGCLSILGAMRTCPLAALEAIIGPTPLHLHSNGTALSSALRYVFLNKCTETFGHMSNI